MSDGMTIADSWLAAETTAFDQLCTRLESKKDFNAFRGFIPEDRDCWSFTSGGSSAAIPVERLWGESPAWCALGVNARFTARYQNRDNCLSMAGKLLAALKQTVNMEKIGNIMYLRVTDMPGEPQPVELEGGMLIWVSEIPLELIFATSGEFDT